MKTAGAHKTKTNGAATVRQQTLKSSIHCAGVALHSGAKVSMTLMPAPVGNGIVFRRTDIGPDALVRAAWDRVVDTRLCTVLGENGITVGTVEHLLAALSGCGIDNAIVELNGPEVPIMDGSAAPFVFLIECAGIVEQDAPRRVIRVLKPVEVEHGRAKARLSPGKYLSMNFEIDFDSAAVSNQRIALGLVNGTFRSEVARARTFGFLQDVEKMRAAGLALGGSLDNAIVIAGDKILNEDGLRFQDEFVRHKVLDAVGDLCLAGAPIIGEFTGVCSGHAVNNRLLRALFADDTAWRYDTMTQEEADSVAAAHHGAMTAVQGESLAASA